MRINELITESQVLDEITRPNSIKNAEEVLKKAGYEKLGEGLYADVFAKSGADHVLKLFDESDNAYRMFVNMTIQNPNTHFPKFKGKMMKVTNDYYAIRMENLERLSTANYQKLELMRDYIYSYVWNKIQPLSWATSMEKLEKAQPGIKKACDLIAHLIINDNLRLDLHMRNAMMRGNTIVFTDPVTGTVS